LAPVPPPGQQRHRQRLLEGAHDPGDARKVLFVATAEGDELASTARAERGVWLDERLRALSAEDRAVIARAAALLSAIADS
jgi:DNA-binding MarR family transcriptional regulator